MLETVWDGLYLRKLALMDTIQLSNWCLMIKSKSSNSNAWDIHGWTPFMKPCIYGHTYVIKGFLLFLEKMEENCGLEKRKYDGNLFQRGLLIVFLSLTPLGFLFPFSSALKLQQEMHMRISFFNYIQKRRFYSSWEKFIFRISLHRGLKLATLDCQVEFFFWTTRGTKKPIKVCRFRPKRGLKTCGRSFSTLSKNEFSN